MGNLFQVLISTLKAKITPIWTKIKLFTNPAFLKTRVFTKVRKFFARIFDVKPRHANDYLGVGRWLVSRKLVIAIAMVIGLLGAYYIFFVNPPSVFRGIEDGYKTYKYDSVALRFTSGKVNILAESGYKAYSGDVEKGQVKGTGTLYGSNGNAIYSGSFDNNMYNGTGILYYPSGQIKYSGSFKDNVYTGHGIEYRENGTTEYEGEFVNGRREGEGIIYDSAGNAVLTGNFTNGELIYSDLLGKSTGQVSNLYKGKRVIYMDSDYFTVYLADIDCAYYGSAGSNTLSGEVPIEGLYIFSDTFKYAGREYSNLNDMKELFPEAEYEGNAYIIMPEAVCIHLLNSRGTAFYGDSSCRLSEALDDVIMVDAFDADYIIYIYNYVLDGIRYTFFCRDRNGDFEMYMMEKTN